MTSKAAATRMRRRTAGVALVALALIAFVFCAGAYAKDFLTISDLETQDNGNASVYNATLYDPTGNYPGVYKTAVDPNEAASAAEAPAIRIPSIADDALADVPTVESPAIICGTAVPFADQENARAFQPCSARVAPYSYFKYSIMDQQGPEGQTLKKLSGFDGTYYIVRIDVTKLWESVDPAVRDKSYLHISQDKNNALLVAVGMDTIAGTAGVDGRDQWGNCSFSNLFTPAGQDGQSGTTQYQRKTASYKLSEMFDADGIDTGTAYFDVIVFSTASIVSGADAQKEGALTGDVELSFYIDQTADYVPEVNWDPASTDTELVRNEQVVDSVVYNGAEQWFDVMATVGGNAYTCSRDFAVTHLDPSGAATTADKIVNAGTYQVVLKGTETFKGTVTKAFTVEPATITEVTLSEASYTYDGAVHKPTVTSVKAGDLELTATDYTVAYSAKNPKAADTYKVTVTGTGNYTGSVTKTFTIDKAENTMTLKGKTAKVAYSKVSKASQTVKRASLIKFTKAAQGKVTYTLSSVSNSKAANYFKMGKGTGNVAVKKGVGKGTYTLKVKVKAAGTANYNAVTKTITCKITVK